MEFEIILEETWKSIQKIDDPSLRFNNLLTLAELYDVVNKSDFSKDIYSEIKDEIEPIEDIKDFIDETIIESGACKENGYIIHLNTAEELLARTVNCFEKADLLLTLTEKYYEFGYPEKAKDIIYNALQLYDTLATGKHNRLFPILSLGTNNKYLMKRILKQAINLSQLMNTRDIECRIVIKLGKLYYQQKEKEKTIKMLTQAYWECRKIKSDTIKSELLLEVMSNLIELGYY